MKISFTILLLLNFTILFSQHHEINDKPIMWKGKQNETDDSTSLLHAFKTGTTHGHFRNFFSSTINEGILTDYYANAIGGGIRYETNFNHKFQFAVSGFYFFNLSSSNLGKPDSLTGQLNRYEIGLFDIENPSNHKDMDRLEELYLKYQLKYGQLIFGRQLVNTPMINLQDGRMRGTGVEGLWFDYEIKNKFKLEGGWLYAVSPRSTTKWYYIDESIGLYPQGVNIDGKKSNYAGHVSSLGVGVLGIKYRPIQNLELQFWDYYIENILNSSLFQFKYDQKVSSKQTLEIAGQFIRQDALNFGGNIDQSKTYASKDSYSLTFGGKLALKTEKTSFSINYNRITKDGRYLFPREWGRDPFFTFLPRERSEGFGDVHSFVLKFDYQKLNSPLKSSLGVGYIQMPDVLNVELNKYGMPSYYQLNLDVRYKFQKYFKGLESQVLLVSKLNNGETYNNKRYEFNKVNMLLINFVLNYHF
jgi:hypothetical protein